MFAFGAHVEVAQELAPIQEVAAMFVLAPYPQIAPRVARRAADERLHGGSRRGTQGSNSTPSPSCSADLYPRVATAPSSIDSPNGLRRMTSPSSVRPGRTPVTS